MQETPKPWKSLLAVVGGIALLALLIFGLEKLASQDEKSNGASTNPPVTAADTKLKGNPNAPVTLLEYADFQCPACAAYHPLLEKLHEDFPDNLKIVYRYFPLATIHKNAITSAKAAEAAHRQGKFWEMNAQLFEHQQDWANLPDPTETFRSYAQTIGLDMNRFNQDISESSIVDAIKADEAMGNEADIMGTPSFFINNTFIQSPQTYDEFKKLIEDTISR